jgi:hypothetical protein
MTPTAPMPSSGHGLGVPTPSGAWQPVLTDEEQTYLLERSRLYLDEHAFTNISDLQDLDRVLLHELMIHRWGVWLGQDHDYNMQPIDDRLVNQQTKEWNTELRQLKKNLGIDRPARERAKGEGSVPHFWANLLARAKAFGVMRCRQLDRALELTNELIGMITTHDNAATEREMNDLGVSESDIIDWVRTIYIPEFQEIDLYFREHEQAIWIRSQ